MNKELNQLNFNKILVLDESIDVDNYNFEEYIESQEHNIKDFCTLCEEKGVNRSTKKPDEFSLKNISHGSHSKDFLDSAYELTDTNNWIDAGIMFIMESPSIDYGIYKELESVKDNISKRPSKDWYWIHGKKKIEEFPHEFKGGKYGTLVASIIMTFKLKNAYLTNIVKCGMNNKSGTKYEGISSFNWQCIDTCFNEILSKEISIIKPKIIFTFGSSTYNNLIYLLKDSKHEDLVSDVIGLPHPAGQRRGFKNIYYQAIYFNLILKALANRDLISKENCHKLIDLYIDKGFD